MLASEGIFRINYIALLAANLVILSQIRKASPFVTPNVPDREGEFISHVKTLTPFFLRAANVLSTSVTESPSASAISAVFIPYPIDQNLYAQSRSPMDMIR